VLDAGDGLIRDKTPATTSQGRSSIELMSHMGYDAAALGEGDLDLLGVEVLQQRIDEARFPFLSANVVLNGTDDLLVEPYTILQVDGHSVAIVGLTGLAALQEVEIRDPLQSVRAVVDELQEQADVLVLLSHAGLEVNRQIAAEVPEIDLIVSGGGQGYTQAPEVVAGSPPIVHADAASPAHAGRRVGIGTWWFDEEGRLIGQEWMNIPLSPEIPDDPVMAAWVLDNP
jgi:5'-nucleotidase/UDP-sugar diphosphatase